MTETTHLQDAVIDTLSPEEPVRWNELVDELPTEDEDAVEDAMTGLLDDGRIRHNPRNGGYTLHHVSHEIRGLTGHARHIVEKVRGDPETRAELEQFAERSDVDGLDAVGRVVLAVADGDRPEPSDAEMALMVADPNE